MCAPSKCCGKRSINGSDRCSQLSKLIGHMAHQVPLTWHLLSLIYHHIPHSPCLEGKPSLMTCVVLSSTCLGIFLSIRSEITLASLNGQFTGYCKTFGGGAPLHKRISCGHCGGKSVALQTQMLGYEWPVITTKRMTFLLISLAHFVLVPSRCYQT